MGTNGSNRFNTIIKGGVCVLPQSNNPSELVLEQADIGINEGLITAIDQIQEDQAEHVIDARNLHVLPGVIDSQVHFRDPGMTHKEDLNSGTMAAAMGGITSVFEMPNTKPATVNAEEIQRKVERAKETAWCNIAFYLGAAATNADQLSELENLPGVCGIKIFMGSSTGDLLVPDDETLFRVLSNGKRRVAVHCEDEARLEERKELLKHQPRVQLHPVWRDAQTALIATSRLLKLAKQAKRNVHVLHVTTSEEIAILKMNKLIASVEVTPQHLTFFEPECYEKLGSLAQMNPPIRDRRHCEALWKGVREGIVDVIGSDHAPHTLEEKKQPYPQSPSGMPGVQTLLPVMLHHVNKGSLSLQRLVELVCQNPAKLFSIKGKGALKVGNHADITIVDLKKEVTINNSWIASKCGWTPFHGMKVTGWPIATIVAGQAIMRNDQLLDRPKGNILEFEIT